MTAYAKLSQALIIAQKDVHAAEKSYSALAKAEERTKAFTETSDQMCLALGVLASLHTYLTEVKNQAHRDLDEFLAANPPIPVLSPKEQYIEAQDKDI